MPGLSGEAYRGVLVYEDGDNTRVEVFGPYNKPAHARAVLTSEVRKWWRQDKKLVDRYIERSTTKWERI
jgi:hypothetical protein